MGLFGTNIDKPGTQEEQDRVMVTGAPKTRMCPVSIYPPSDKAR